MEACHRIKNKKGNCDFLFYNLLFYFILQFTFIASLYLAIKKNSCNSNKKSELTKLTKMKRENIKNKI